MIILLRESQEAQKQDKKVHRQTFDNDERKRPALKVRHLPFPHLPLRSQGDLGLPEQNPNVRSQWVLLRTDVQITDVFRRRVLYTSSRLVGSRAQFLPNSWRHIPSIPADLRGVHLQRHIRIATSRRRLKVSEWEKRKKKKKKEKKKKKKEKKGKRKWRQREKPLIYVLCIHSQELQTDHTL